MSIRFPEGRPVQHEPVLAIGFRRRQWVRLSLRYQISFANRSTWFSEGRARAKGKRPGWLTAASDVALISVSGGEESVLTFEAPTLGRPPQNSFARESFPGQLVPNPERHGLRSAR